MPKTRRAGLLLFIVGLLLAQEVSGQDAESLVAPYSAEECQSCAGWNEPREPFKIHGDSYYVGTRGLSAILLTSTDGHILIDGGLPNSAPLIMENVRALGFDVEDIQLILNSHSHFDHAGGIAAIRNASGARVAASPESAEVIERGRSGPSDPQFGVLLDYPAVRTVDRFTPGDTLHVGSLSIGSHSTAGHTPGGTSWSWQSCDADGCVDIVYADSQTPVSADGFRYSDSEAYPSAVEDYEEGHRTLEELPCDILITTHPGATNLWERLDSGPQGLVNAKACRDYAAHARKQLRDRLKREQGDL